MSKIFSHSTCLAAELVARFKSLHHENGKPVVQLYGKWKTYDHNLASPGVEHEASLTGPTVTFNVCDLDGSVIGYDEVSRIATLNQPPIQLRTGCFCNPGACQDALLLSDNDILKNYSSGHVCGDRKGIVDGRPTGCIRASFGKESLWEDMDALASFVEKTFLSQGKASIPEKSHTASSASRFEIDSMYIFPIKSCAGMKVDQWPIERDTGKLVLDREFALVDASGVAMRLSSYPQMSQIYPIVDTSTNTMVVSAPDHEKLILSLETTSGMSVSSKEIEVCGILCKGAVWGGRKASDWFTSVLGVRCWLARHEGSAKATNLKEDNKNTQPSYSNEAAILLVSQPSVDVLNSIIRTQGWGRQVDHRHFRPNIVVRAKDAGNQPKVGEHPEDLWQRILISGKTQQVELIATGKCARCQMVDIDPTSGMKGNTLKALAQYRRDRGRIYFGTFFSGVNDSNYENSEDVVRLNIGDDIESFE
jgi:molybdenum cofactor sulfurtransferase